MTVISIKPDKSIDSRYDKKPYIERIEYKKEIISSIDKREMLLVRSGKFLMGSASGEKDEFPESIEDLPDFYIDKYEVSNSDFKQFLDETAGHYPDYWNNKLGSDGEFTSEYFRDLPAIVTYMEAAKYAAWCGKRLPDEKEWEKAARRPLDSEKKNMDNVYTWGNDFVEGISNIREFWENDNTGKNLKETVKKEYKLEKLNKGYIPVKIYEPSAVSYYGVVHMDGNALEWTESWYEAYKNNHFRDKRFGNQYKVVRGGSYFLPEKNSRVTDRKIGGIPGLEKDRMAGFRCVKDVSPMDRLN
jgi:formylglycine-generating enzyme required for sulfatase activity